MCPSGSTSHQRPFHFSVRNMPVAFSCGPAPQPPNRSTPGIGDSGCTASFSSSAFARAFSSSSEWTFPGQSACMYCPNSSTNGKKASSILSVMSGCSPSAHTRFTSNCAGVSCGRQKTMTDEMLPVWSTLSGRYLRS